MKGHRRFNNSLIIKLSKDPLLQKAFILFAEVHGEEMIAASRIHDKASHLSALKKYQSLCLEEELRCVRKVVVKREEEAMVKIEEE